MNLDDLLNQVADDAMDQTLSPPSEIRKIGDDLRASRRTRMSVVAAASVAAVLALATGAVVLRHQGAANPEPARPPALRVTLFDQAGDVSFVASDGTRQTLPVKNVDRFALSPDGHRIAYTTSSTTDVDRQLWIADADGSDSHRLPAPCPACQPGYGVTWSHDGTRLAYIVWTPGKKPAQLRIRTLSTGRERTLRMPAGLEPRGPTFSPDDRVLAITVVHQTRQYVATLVPALGMSSLTPMGDTYSQVQLPSWSADGQTVYFTATTRGEDNNDVTASNDLYAANADGSGSRRITHASPGERFFGATAYQEQFLISRARSSGPWVVGWLSGNGSSFTPLKGPNGKRVLGTAAELQP